MHQSRLSQGSIGRFRFNIIRSWLAVELVENNSKSLIKTKMIRHFGLFWGPKLGKVAEN